MSDAATPAQPASVPSTLRYLLRVIPTVYRVGFSSALAYRAEMVIWMFATNMPLIMLALWAAVARSGPVAGYTQADFTAYYLCGLVVRHATGCWVVYELTMEIRGGTLSMRLLRPIHPLLAHAIENLGATPMRIAVASPLIALFLFESHAAITGDPFIIFLFFVALTGAWLITFSVMAMVGTLALFFESAQGLFQIWLGISTVLSGYIVPLDLFTPRLRDFARALPFRFLLSYPIELLLGRVDRLHALQLLAAQWGYAALFLGGTLLLWRAGMRRYGAYGG